MAFNTEMFQRVLAEIEKEDAAVGFDMSDWEHVMAVPTGGSPSDSEAGPVCATTRCVAGWAVSLHVGDNLISNRDGWGTKVPSRPVRALAAELDCAYDDYDIMGATLLGLEMSEGDQQMFYVQSEAVALELVRLGAAGDEDGFRRRLRQYNDGEDW
jgi:hypothetical protein